MTLATLSSNKSRKILNIAILLRTRHVEQSNKTQQKATKT